MIKIELQSQPYGAIIAQPVSERWKERFAGHMSPFFPGVPKRELCQAFFQSHYDLPQSVRQNRRAMADLDAGWPVTVLVDPWEYGHWLGYDAHIASYA